MAQALTAYEMVKGGHQTISELVDCVKDVALRNAQRSKECADLAGEESDAHVELLGGIRKAIGSLNAFLIEVEADRVHIHKWNADQYCMICGADGAA